MIVAAVAGTLQAWRHDSHTDNRDALRPDIRAWPPHPHSRNETALRRVSRYEPPAALPSLYSTCIDRLINPYTKNTQSSIY